MQERSQHLKSPVALIVLICGIGASLYPQEATVAPDVPAQVDTDHERTMPTRTPGAVTETELGRLLFWDPILSGDMDVACATCHHPDFAYADGLDLSLGTESVGLGPSRVQVPGSSLPPVKRNAQTVLNTAFNGLDDDGGRGRRGRGRERIGGDPVQFLQTLSLTRAPMFWDNRVRSLEEQALEPIKMQEEMRGNAFSEAAALDSVAARLRSNPEYVRLFDAVYDTLIGADQIGRAIAAFERTLVAVDSPFDRFMDGEEDALTPQQLRGLEEFRDADCDECHNGPMFSDYDLHVLGIAENPKLTLADPGAGRFQFRTPSLRNVALTAPYMHNGMLATLEDVLEFYDEGDSRNPNVADGGRGRRDRDDDGGAVAGLDRDFRSVDNMSRDEMRDIIAFLNALTDEDFDRTIPSSVPSGLPPGGAVATP